MRVAGGEAKGRRLKGSVTAGTRATTERVRAAIFNILDPGQYQGRRVLDLFAGSGSLGIEALSRGADWVDFVEQDRKQCAVVSSNLEATGFAGQAQVHRADVFRILPDLPGPYQLVLMDPPYPMGDFSVLLDSIASQLGLVDYEGVVIAGHSKRLELRARYGDLQLTSHREYGDNVVDFYLREEQPQGITAREAAVEAIDTGTKDALGGGPEGDTIW